MLAIKNISKTYPAPQGGTIRVFEKLDLLARPGDTLSIMGPSGSGKSTLFNIIGGLDRDFSGEVLLENRNLGTIKPGDLLRLRNQRIGYIFQHHHLLPQLTVLENVLIPVLPYGSPGERSAARERALFLLEQAGLGERTAHRPAQLSGGQCIRCSIVRSLINKPALLLADEPTGFLDAHTAATMGELLLTINRQEGTALIVFTHSENLARTMDRQYRIQDYCLRPYRL